MGCSEFGDDSRDSNSLKVEVLIGLDMYWEVVSGRFVKNRMGALGLETVFGNALSGPVNMNPVNLSSRSKTSFHVDISCKAPPISQEFCRRYNF